MILLVHMLFGAAIGSMVQSLPLALLLALLGHYFLDVFPHIEYLKGVEHSIVNFKASSRHKNSIDMAKVAADFLLGLLLIFLAASIDDGNLLPIYLCALIAIVPDGLTVVHSLFPKLGLAKHHHIHGTTIHYLTKQKTFPKAIRILTQVIAASISIAILAY